MINIKGFIRSNPNKKITITVWLCAAWYRFRIRFFPMKYLKKNFGTEGEESPEEGTAEEYRYAKLISRYVNRSADKTPWESKCLVRALTAQRLLKKKNIPNTLYLGVKTEDGKMLAHAWLRTGKMYVTGGNGEGYAMVAKYRA